MKTRWGTCNIEAQRIWLNLELIKKPVHCLEYMIVYEMIHLLERHHNERSIAYMNRFMPLWQFYRENSIGNLWGMSRGNTKKLSQSGK